MRVCRITDDAHADLDGLWWHIAIGHPARADAVIRRLGERCLYIASVPGIGRPRPDLGEGVRSTPFLGTTICYTIMADGVTILRIAGRGRDLSRMFPRPPGG